MLKGKSAVLLTAVIIFFGGCANEARLLQAKEGDILWQHRVGTNMESIPAVDSKGNVYTAGETSVYSFALDGTCRWTTEVGAQAGEFNSAALSPDEKTVYGGGVNFAYAIDAATGKVKWKNTDFKVGFHSVPAVSADGSRLYFGVGAERDEGDSFYCIDTADGSVKWEYVMAHPAQGFHGYLGGAIVGADGTIYVASQHGWLLSLTDNGKSYTENWTYDVGAEMRMPPSMDGDGYLYVGSSDAGGYVHKVDSRTGKSAGGNWPVKTTAGEVFAHITIGADGTLYVNSEDRRLWAFNPDGTVKWNNLKFEIWGSDPLIRDDGRIIVGVQLNGAARVACIRDEGARAVIEWTSDPIADTLHLNETNVNIAPDGTLYITSGRDDKSLSEVVKIYALQGNGLGLSKNSPWPKYMGNIQNNGHAANKAYNEFYKRVQADEPYIGFFAAEKKCINKVDEAYKKARRRFFLGVSVSDEEVERHMGRFVRFCKDKGYLNDGCEEDWEKTLTILSYVLYANKPIFEFTADNIIEHRNLVFAEYPNKKLELDLFLPKEPMDEPVPCVVCIHGGGWRVNRRIWFEPFAKYLASKGMAAVTIDYRMLPAVEIIDCIYDSKAAVRWVRANAGKYGIDPDRIGAIGASAGAHIIALLATTANVPELEGSGGNADVSSAIQAAVGFATPAFKIEEGSSGRAKRFGFTEEETKRISPYENISASSAPLYLVHGTKDRTVNPQDSQDLHDRYKEAGADVELKWILDKGHDFYEGTDFGIALAAEFFKKQFE